MCYFCRDLLIKIKYLKYKLQMKTKNVPLLLIIISSVLNTYGVKAEDQVKSVTVNLNILLNPIQTITVTATQNIVDINYKTIDDYETGVSVTQKNHLKIFSTGGFTVSVQADGNLTNSNGKEIQSSDVTLLAENGTGNEVKNTTTAEIALDSEQPLISSDTGGRNLMYHITYSNKTGTKDKYINHYKNNDDNTFKTSITYTIAAK